MDPLLTFEETAARMRQPEGTLRWLLHKGEAPPSAKIGRRLVFRQSAVDAWIDAQFEDAAG